MPSRNNLPHLLIGTVIGQMHKPISLTASLWNTAQVWIMLSYMVFSLCSLRCKSVLSVCAHLWDTKDMSSLSSQLIITQSSVSSYCWVVCALPYQDLIRNRTQNTIFRMHLHLHGLKNKAILLAHVCISHTALIDCFFF